MHLSPSIVSALLASSQAGYDITDKYNGPCEGDNPVKLRIGNGGAGQSGLVKGGHIIHSTP